MATPADDTAPSQMLNSSAPSGQQSQAQLMDLLTQPNRWPPIFEAIARNLDIHDLLKLRRVSRAMSAVYSTVQATQLNINTTLTTFFKDPVAFRNVLGLVSGVISGNFALNFLDRRATGDRLDVFAYGQMGGMTNAEFLAWWIAKEGYDIIDSYVHDPANTNGNNTNQSYRTTVYKRPGLNAASIYLQHTRESPVVDLLNSGRQRTLALANFITSTTAYALFPHDTFRNYRAYLHNTLEDDGVEYLKGVAATGRRILDIRQKDEHESKKCRKFCDGKTWIMRLDTVGIGAPATPDFVLDATSFDLDIDRSWARDWRHYTTRLHQIEHPALQYVWMSTASIDYRLNAAMAVELSLASKDKWPGSGSMSLTQLLQSGQHLLPGGIEMHRYYDDMMVEWLEDELGCIWSS